MQNIQKLKLGIGVALVSGFLITAFDTASAKALSKGNHAKNQQDVKLAQRICLISRSCYCFCNGNPIGPRLEGLAMNTLRNNLFVGLGRGHLLYCSALLLPINHSMYMGRSLREEQLLMPLNVGSQVNRDQARRALD